MAEEKYVPRLKTKYLNEVKPAMQEKFQYKNVMEIPKFEKIVVNMGVGEAATDSKAIDGAVRDLRAITGQQPMITRARKSIASFRLRAGMPIGAKVTLRGDRMWEFFDRLTAVAIPRIRDFRGISPKSFDGRGNFSMGVTEQLIFPEIDFDSVDHTRGMDITIVTTAKTDEEAKALLEMIVKQQRKQKFSTREYTRCQRCGRPHSVYRKFGLCRVCFRELALKGELPGIKKASW